MPVLTVEIRLFVDCLVVILLLLTPASLPGGIRALEHNK